MIDMKIVALEVACSIREGVAIAMRLTGLCRPKAESRPVCYHARESMALFQRGRAALTTPHP